jgi:hypothetical protein
MNPNGLLTSRQLDDLLPIVCVLLGCSLIVLPAVTLGIARKWSATQPQLSGAILGGAIAITLFGIFATSFIILALIGWIPPLSQLLGHG